MQPLWCWRCKMEVPMLDEDEYTLVLHACAQLMGTGLVSKRAGA